MTKSLTFILFSMFALGCTESTTDATGAGTGKGDIAAGSCDDGEPAYCTLAEPSCPIGTVSALIDGCWTCADANTCEPLGLPLNCDDGLPAVCTLAEPVCPAGTIAAQQNGCWTCANPFTCEAYGLPLDCNEGQAVCTLAEPECGFGKVAATRGGCWACVDPFTCE